MSVKISIPGGNGRMGKTLIKEIIENKNLELANSYCLPNEKEKGLDLGTLVGHNPIDKVLIDNPLSIFEDTEVIIDFTVPEASIFHVEKAAAYKIPIVIGTTGFSNEQFDKIKSFSNQIPIVYSANFSIGIAIMKKLISDATKNLGTDWEVEIFETHHNKKVDSPSGTALLLGSVVASVRGNNLDDVKKLSRKGIIGKREKNEIGFSVVRGGNVIGEHSIKYFNGDERLEINHLANNRSIFAKGAIRSAIWSLTQKPGFFTLDHV
ncbi:4-hydroxy-tetrahydrodipicolinate reductase, partial [Alphaproteobacteria bacterium]|nr:4-hydroxy-tetrahydrodipicolinate reductase [Alphaproteobacteria bacterium]